jgi:16S rRNA (cytidine1402-2'-O)-methyltransferase
MIRVLHDNPQMSGTLYVVATPIGNLEDITLRALRVLREADVIAAEDTRRTAKLLTHYGIDTPTLSVHEHNMRSRVPQLLERLRGGARVALVTDAGVPGVSDPGVELVQACAEAGIPVDPIPGASAALSAAVASGFPLTPLTVLGFPPVRGKDRTTWFLALAQIPHTATFFEAPHRVLQTLGELVIHLVDRPICVARELTKAHQEILRGSASEVLEHLEAPRGEFTVVVSPASKIHQSKEIHISDEDALREFGELTNTNGVRRREAIAEVARKFGRSTRDIYAAVERAKNAAR